MLIDKSLLVLVRSNRTNDVKVLIETAIKIGKRQNSPLSGDSKKKLPMELMKAPEKKATIKDIKNQAVLFLRKKKRRMKIKNSDKATNTPISIVLKDAKLSRIKLPISTLHNPIIKMDTQITILDFSFVLPNSISSKSIKESFILINFLQDVSQRLRIGDE